MADKNIMSYETVALDEENHALVIIDQTKLPGEVEILHLTEQKDIWQAIYLLQVRGAPAIGVAAGFGLYLAARQIQAEDFDGFYRQLHEAKEYLNSSRPTAVNLSWALNRMEQVAIDNRDKPVAEIKELLRRECIAIKDEDVWMCRKIGEYGLSLIKDGDGVLTHCNAGQLATSKYGTALAPIHLGREKGMHFRVYCDETRPLLQGARLSSFEMLADGVDTTVICDNMASQVMKNGWVNAVFVGCDRVAANGDVTKKTGTSRRGYSGEVLWHSLLCAGAHLHHRYEYRKGRGHSHRTTPCLRSDGNVVQAAYGSRRCKSLQPRFRLCGS